MQESMYRSKKNIRDRDYELDYILVGEIIESKSNNGDCC
jgi:hypothetical protein